MSKCQKYTSQVFVKEVTTIATRSASTILIAFVLTTLFLFAILRIFDVARVIQMNMEISIVCAHGCLILPSSTEAVEVNRRILISLFFFNKNNFCTQRNILKRIDIYLILEMSGDIHTDTLLLYLMFYVHVP